MYRYRYRARAKTGKRHLAVKATAVEFHVENVEIPFYLFFSHLLRSIFFFLIYSDARFRVGIRSGSM